MQYHKKDNPFQGLWPAMFAPVDHHGEVSVGALEKLIEVLIAEDLDGLYLLGSTGQGFLFSEQQRKHIIEVSLEIINGRLPVIVQVGALNTDESVRLAKHAALKGADGISSVGPIYYHASAAMGIEHYRKIASATELPFFPYQIGNAIMNEEVINSLLAIPNIAGMKLTTPNLVEISNIHNRVGDAWRLFSGADELLCHASLCGTSGAIGTSYNLIGRICKNIRQDFVDGNVALGKEFMLSLQHVIQQILPVIWSFFRRAMQLKHGIDIGSPKPPLLASPLPWGDEELMKMINNLEEFAVRKNTFINKQH